MLDLVRFQKKEIKLVVGAEDVIYTASDMIRMENANKKKLGVLADIPVYSISYPQIKKIATLKNHIGVCKIIKKEYNGGKILNSKTNLRDTLSIKFLQLIYTPLVVKIS